MSTQLTYEQIANAWDSFLDDGSNMPTDVWLQAVEIVIAYLKLPVGKVAKAPAAVCKSMELPTGSTWMAVLADIADFDIDWEDFPGEQTYLQQVRAAQAADDAKRAAKRSQQGGAS